MSRTLRASILLLFLASCGGGNFSAPRNLDDACSVIHQRPSYLKAMQANQRKWGVPISVQMAVLYQESKFIGNARTPHQYALGVIPMGAEVRSFVDALGLLNQSLASACARVTLMVAGLPLHLKDAP